MARRDLGLAARCWSIVEGFEGGRQDLRARAKGLGPMLLGSGLAATAAFLSAKASGTDQLARAYRAVLDGMASHVFATLGVEGQPDLVTWLAAHPDHVTYRRAAAAAADFAIWLSRAAEALIQPAEPTK